ncbi:Crp/Fnr family transcriptional regulator [Muricauda sp. 334s03]|uniref:Crp/Fnr family transcriptional regulator n=1 Tax=Flagellimonas yonaguniensis TaxID=3031325 RepID=A0ABT5Y198_9FLAO|nr:Crp/Fnr family transcriptional regulator [[Muricauda] yonaguniensis]MDF0717148.1 Crp/Fnr family transcriptional regulator [[Muricauda] yonaguniensis]
MKAPQQNETYELKTVLDSMVKINDLEWRDFIKGLQRKNLSKGEHLWKKDQFCDSLVFLQSGLIRSYSYLGPKEVTHAFYFEKSLFYDDYSFLSHRPCTKAYQALEDSEILFINRSYLQSMYDRHKCFERLGRLALENAHIAMVQNMERIRLFSAEENYCYLSKHYPGLLQRVPLKTIASYLNISPEHLSRIRAKKSIQRTTRTIY